MSTNFESRLRGQLDQTFSDPPPEPALADVISECERDLRQHRRRLTVGAVASTAAAVALAVGVPSLIAQTPGAPDDVVAGGVGASTEELVESCRDGNQPAYWTDLIFGAGTPRLAAQSAATEQTSTVLVSRDGKYWADCFNAGRTLAGAAVTMTVYAAEPSPTRPAYSAGLMCVDSTSPESCDRFVIDYADRLPAAVEQVSFRTADGVTTTVPTDAEGFVLFDYDGTAPPEDTADSGRGKAWITRISYLDGSGAILASENVGPDGPAAVKGFAPLTDYPSLARTIRQDRASNDVTR